MVELLAILGLSAGIMYFIYTAGQQTAKAKTNKEAMDAISKALKARDSIKSPDDARKLLLEHAVHQLPVVHDSKTND